jgi:23S rRNA (uracil1939-C5)-methyltransferase
MTVTFRWTSRDGAVWWRGRAAENDIWLVEDSPVGPLSVPRNSFYQTNPAVARLLVGEVSRLLAAAPPRRVIDLYCGVGIFALAAAQQGVPKVIGLDIDGPALKAAAYNATKLNLPDIQWIAGSAHKTSISGPGGNRRPGGCIPLLTQEPDTTVIVDPPRTGLGRPMIRELARLAPTRILYVSCAADTMARDAAWLKESGYTLRHSRVFDMFPRTPHFESLTEFTLNHFP